MSAPGLAARLAAIALVSGVLREKRMLSTLVASEGGPVSALPAQERARAQSLALNILRHLQPIDAILDEFLSKPPPDIARDALRLAATEMLVEGIAPHAAVDAAVRIVRTNKKNQRFSGLVNAVARKVATQGPELWTRHRPQNLPAALRKPLRKAWGKGALMRVEAAHATGAPLDLTLKDPAASEHWAKELGAILMPNGSLRLQRAGQVSKLPGYARGAWWVQDAAATIPARLLGDVSGQRVLDLCAAPGGKTQQLATAGAIVTALDISGERMNRVAENLRRVELKADLVVADALDWRPEKPFDAILLDAPCSATGTIRRHPDLPFVRDGQNLGKILELQSTLLKRAANWLKPGGRMVFGTCSLLPSEGEEQAANFLKSTEGWRAVPPEAVALGLNPDWITEGNGIRLRPDYWPEQGGMDGFFAILLESTAPAR